MERDCITSYIGVGSNLDSPQKQVRSAMDELDSLESCRIIGRSSLYITKPVGFAQQPDFVNAVCKITTGLDPQRLLSRLLDIEESMGRVRGALPNRPRRIDLDLLLYGTQQINTPELIVPHPRMHERRFVLEPLIEVDQNAVIPGKGNAKELFEECIAQEVVKVK